MNAQQMDQLSDPVKNDFDIFRVSTQSGFIEHPDGAASKLQGFDYIEIVNKICNESSCSTADIVAVSKNTVFLSRMAQYRIGTLWFSSSGIHADQYLPDVICRNPQNLFNFLIGQYSSYPAESLAEDRGTENLFAYCLKLPVDSMAAHQKFVPVFFGGRYLPVKYRFFPDHPLSFLILRFKDLSKHPIPQIDAYFDQMISRISKTYFSGNFPDFITYPPVKDHGRKNRFSDLTLTNCKKNGSAVLDVFECTRAFSQVNSSSRGARYECQFQLQACQT